MASSSPFTQRQFFGGAIVCDVPTAWKDISDLRQVPDHQEVYLGADMPNEPNLVVEILEHQSTVSDREAPQYLFQDLAEANESQETSFKLRHPSPSSSEYVFFTGKGQQVIAMGRSHDIHGNALQQEIRYSQIELGVLRLPQVGTDLLVTISQKKVASTDNSEPFSADFQRILSSFKIRDWNLFAVS